MPGSGLRSSHTHEALGELRVRAVEKYDTRTRVAVVVMALRWTEEGESIGLGTCLVVVMCVMMTWWSGLSSLRGEH